VVVRSRRDTVIDTPIPRSDLPSLRGRCRLAIDVSPRSITNMVGVDAQGSWSARGQPCEAA